MMTRISDVPTDAPIHAKTVLITGASSGIGRATALEFARQGAHVVATARRAERLSELQAEAIPLPGDILPVTADVTQPDDMVRAVQTALDTWGRLDVLVANAGIGHRGSLVDAPWDDLATVLRTNVDGVLHSIRAAVPAMRAGGGHIVLVSSISGSAPAPFAAIYGASKSFVNGLGRALRQELAADHIWVTNVLVGQTHSEFAQNRLGRPGRVAGKLPTMQAETVARRIVWASEKRRRVVVLRLIDRAFLLAAALTPGLLDRLQRMVYK
ncbi:MAG: SDR family NAD(P)-dependent oxidoreductase [Anaerolineae bacterium]|nr:SDR family NAD(P)-dependent oxidoreductase [Anaerolineae bacterium]